MNRLIGHYSLDIAHRPFRKVRGMAPRESPVAFRICAYVTVRITRNLHCAYRPLEFMPDVLESEVVFKVVNIPRFSQIDLVLFEPVVIMRKKIALFMVVSGLAVWPPSMAQAAMTVTAARGGTNISADNAQNGV